MLGTPSSSSSPSSCPCIMRPSSSPSSSSLSPACWIKLFLHEGQAGFRAKRSCVDNIYVLSELVQGRLREGKKTYAFFLDVQKA